MGPLCAVLGRSWGQCWRSGGGLGTYVGDLELLLCLYGQSVLCRSWGLYRRPWLHLGRLWLQPSVIAPNSKERKKIGMPNAQAAPLARSQRLTVFRAVGRTCGTSNCEIASRNMNSVHGNISPDMEVYFQIWKTTHITHAWLTE